MRGMWSACRRQGGAIQQGRAEAQYRPAYRVGTGGPSVYLLSICPAKTLNCSPTQLLAAPAPAGADIVGQSVRAAALGPRFHAAVVSITRKNAALDFSQRSIGDEVLQAEVGLAERCRVPSGASPSPLSSPAGSYGSLRLAACRKHTHLPTCRGRVCLLFAVELASCLLTLPAAALRLLRPPLPVLPAAGPPAAGRGAPVLDHSRGQPGLLQHLQERPGKPGRLAGVRSASAQAVLHALVPDPYSRHHAHPIPLYRVQCAAAPHQQPPLQVFSTQQG